MAYEIYAGRWIARNERGDVVGTGETSEMARHMAQAMRPKERFHLLWVTPRPPHLALPEWLIQRVVPLLPTGQVWLVGGIVRDLLLDRPHHDWDFVVDGDGCTVARAMASQLGGAYVPLDPERGTGRVVTYQLTGSRIILDFNTLRGATLEEDLRLRDFTINAMALSLMGELTDPWGGRADLEARQVRVVGPHSFPDDPLRMLRAVRMAVELQFSVEKDTAEQMVKLAAQIRRPAAERVREELLRIFRARPLLRGLEMLHESTLLPHLLPELVALETVYQTSPHYLPSAWKHTCAALAIWDALLTWLEGRADEAPETVAVGVWEALQQALAPYQEALLTYLRGETGGDITRADAVTWGVLFHDTGKALTRSVDGAGRAHFYGHAQRGAELTQMRLEALAFPHATQALVAALVEHHMDPIELERNLPLSRRAIYRFFRDTGEAGAGVLLLALADVLAVYGPQLDRAAWKRRLALTQTLLEAYFERATEMIAPPPLLNGHDLLALGVPAGPRIGALLAALREAQAAGELTTRDEAEAYVRKHWQA